jgi:hypothetical protein
LWCRLRKKMCFPHKNIWTNQTFAKLWSKVSSNLTPEPHLVTSQL